MDELFNSVSFLQSTPQTKRRSEEKPIANRLNSVSQNQYTSKNEESPLLEKFSHDGEINQNHKMEESSRNLNHQEIRKGIGTINDIQAKFPCDDKNENRFGNVDEILDNTIKESNFKYGERIQLRRLSKSTPDLDKVTHCSKSNAMINILANFKKEKSKSKEDDVSLMGKSNLKKRCTFRDSQKSEIFRLLYSTQDLDDKNSYVEYPKKRYSDNAMLRRLLSSSSSVNVTQQPVRIEQGPIRPEHFENRDNFEFIDNVLDRAGINRMDPERADGVGNNQNENLEEIIMEMPTCSNSASEEQQPDNECHPTYPFNKISFIKKCATINFFTFFMILIAILQGTARQYMISISRTWVSEFELSRHWISVILGISEVVQGAYGLALFMFENKKRRHVYLFGILLTYQAICCVVMAFLYIFRRNLGVCISTEILFCHETGTIPPCFQPITGSSEKIYSVAILFFVQATFGVAGVCYFVYGMIYIDNNVPKSNTPLYFGICLAARQWGPQVGLYLASYYLSIQETVDRKGEYVQTKWWIGWLFIATGFFIVARFVSMFPKRLSTCPEYHISSMAEAPLIERNDGIIEMVCCNKIFILNAICVGFIRTTTVIFDEYEKDYIKAKFLLKNDIVDAYDMNFLTSMRPLASGIALVVVSVVYIYFKPSTRKTTAWNVLCAMLGLTFHLYFLIYSCNPFGPLNEQTVFTTFDKQCHCSKAPFRPVCHTNLTFYSPCHAGCDYTNADNSEVFNKCRYMESNGNSSTVFDGSCGLDECAYLWKRFEIVRFIFLTIINTTSLGGILVALRTIDDENNKIALAIYCAYMHCVSYLILKITSEIIEGESCLIENSTGCILHGLQYGDSMNKLAAACFIISIVSGIGCFFASKNIDLYHSVRSVSPELRRQSQRSVRPSVPLPQEESTQHRLPLLQQRGIMQRNIFDPERCEFEQAHYEEGDPRMPSVNMSLINWNRLRPLESTPNKRVDNFEKNSTPKFFYPKRDYPENRQYLSKKEWEQLFNKYIKSCSETNFNDVRKFSSDLKLFRNRNDKESLENKCRSFYNEKGNVSLVDSAMGLSILSEIPELPEDIIDSNENISFVKDIRKPRCFKVDHCKYCGSLYIDKINVAIEHVDESMDTVSLDQYNIEDTPKPITITAEVYSSQENVKL